MHLQGQLGPSICEYYNLYGVIPLKKKLKMEWKLELELFCHDRLLEVQSWVQKQTKLKPLIHENSKKLIRVPEEIFPVAIKFSCFEVLEVIGRMDLGFNHERGTILSHLAEASKLLAKKQFSEEQISEEEFSAAFRESMDYFNDYQQCLVLCWKKS